MKSIDRIITEQINRLVLEAEEGGKKYDSYGTEIDGDKEHRSQLGSELEVDHDQDGTINYRKLASKMYGIPTDTSNKENVNKLNSKASALRKKIKGLSAPNGGNYDLSKSEESKIKSLI